MWQDRVELRKFFFLNFKCSKQTDYSDICCRLQRMKFKWDESHLSCSLFVFHSVWFVVVAHYSGTENVIELTIKRTIQRIFVS